MARLMVALSLLVNVAVLLPVCVGLLTNASWATSAYGEATPARAILLSIYLAIGIVSVLLLVRRERKAVAALLLVQVLYKLTTPLTVGTIVNPVVMSNLVIAAFHAATLICLWRGRALGGSTDVTCPPSTRPTPERQS
jgi:protein-S-isoprenylcysteine O-methyltransferase Ste14